MKLLFDQNLSFKLCAKLNDLFPESRHVNQLGLTEAKDRALWDYAKSNNFVLVSHDSDFAEMAALLGPPPRVIWVRCGNQPTAVVERILRDNADVIRPFGSDDTSACLELY